MLEGSYGKEPFDLRLTTLRFIRCLDKILLLTLIGTLLFGGGYYVKKVLLRPEKEYSATSTYKVEYTEPPTQSGDYYINEMTWNTLVQSREFLVMVQKYLAEIGDGGTGAPMEMSVEELAAAISAKLPSDWKIPTITVVTKNPEETVCIAGAVECVMENEFAEGMEEICAVRVIDPVTAAEEVIPDVRPVRAFVLSVLLSFFFVTVFFLLKEIGDDGIWLPATLRQRYGLAVLGTINSMTLKENARYLFSKRGKVAVCSVDDSVDVAEVGRVMKEKLETETEELSALSWVSVPNPLLNPEGVRMMREMDGILLVVPAGNHVGKPLEYVMEYMAQQDCKITAAILWNADEKLIDAYYWMRRR